MTADDEQPAPAFDLVSLEADLRTLTAARRSLAQGIGAVSAQQRQAVILCAGELMANAVRHGGAASGSSRTTMAAPCRWPWATEAASRPPCVVRAESWRAGGGYGSSTP